MCLQVFFFSFNGEFISMLNIKDCSLWYVLSVDEQEHHLFTLICTFLTKETYQ